MFKRLFLGLLLGCTVTAGTTCAADGWLNLKLGMTEEQAESVLGAPLLRSEGRGFDLWTYDNRAEVIFYGGVIAWTAPATKTGPQRVVENWQFNQGNTDRVMLPVPQRRKAPASRAPAQPGNAYAFRYRQR